MASVTNSEIETNIEQFANDAISANYLNTNNVVLNAHLQLTDGWLWLNGQSLISKTTFTVTPCFDLTFRRSENSYLT